MTEQPDTASESYIMLETAFGWCGLAWNERGITRLQLPEASPEITERKMAASGRKLCRDAMSLPAPIAEVARLLRRYFSGAPTDFAAVEIDFGPRQPAQLALYAEARKIHWGATATYGELARAVDMPGGARAVGQAMGRNPVPIIMPCHRVLASGSALRGFSAPGGIATKKRLLELEGATAVDHLPLFATRA